MPELQLAGNNVFNLLFSFVGTNDGDDELWHRTFGFFGDFFRILIGQFEMITPTFLHDLSIHVDVMTRGPSWNFPFKVHLRWLISFQDSWWLLMERVSRTVVCWHIGWRKPPHRRFRFNSIPTLTLIGSASLWILLRLIGGHLIIESDKGPSVFWQSSLLCY
jgi:hypothetical protein